MESQTFAFHDLILLHPARCTGIFHLIIRTETPCYRTN
ncbi:hypothetical protein C7S15_4657 [Burkholderia cepacia]|nr:hypothetical protein [Burkholderia cepacia]